MRVAHGASVAAGDALGLSFSSRMFAPASEFRGTARFEILGRTGQGGAGFVYEVFDHDRKARLALKTLRSVGPESILLLKNEFRAIQGLIHPNLVTPKELFEEDGRFFFTMDFVEGTDFLSYVRPGALSSIRPSARPPSSGSDREPTVGAPALSGAIEREREREREQEAAPLDVERLRAALGQLVIGLSALHADHKVHRDVKPSNVLVGRDGHVHILDFGIVGDLAGVRADDDWQLVGTILFMAPEQAAGEAPTPAADWYAVGSMLYQALTGQAPFTGSNHEILAQKMVAEPPAPASIAADVPPDLNELAVDLLRVDPSQRPEGFQILARLGITTGASSTRVVRAASFVGRGAELAAIDAAFAQVVGGRPATVLVEGDSGVGKSWLVREFTRRAATRDDALVFRGRCYERESLPYKAVDSLVDDLARYLSSLRDDEAAALLPEGAGALRTAFPVLETVSAMRVSHSPLVDVRNPQEVRARMFEAFRTLLVNIALYRRLVLVIDDLQWADEDSLALLTELLRPVTAPPLLLLASIRSSTDPSPQGIHQRLARLPGDTRRVHLDPLPPEDARELIANLLSAAPKAEMAARDVDAIFAEAKGHPLFIEEIVRYRASHAASAPTRLDDALWERAQGLSPDARNLLELVVVAGVPLQQDVAAAAGGLDFGKTFDAVGVLRAAHFVRTSGVYRHDTVEPYHDRVRESVLHNIDEPARRRRHASLARALEESGADAERLIPHWVGAGESARAAESAIRAGEAAAGALAFDHAASLYRLAIELGKPEGEAAIELNVKLAEALTNAGRGADAAAVYLAVAGDGASLRAIELRRRAGEQLVCSGHVEEGTRTFEGVLEAVGVRAPRAPAAILLSIVGSNLSLALTGFGFTARRAETIDSRMLLRLDCLASAGPGLGMSDHIRGKEFQVRTLVEALKVGEPGRVCRALGYYGLGRASEGLPVFARLMEVQKLVETMANDLNQPYFHALASAVTAFAYYLSGRPREARAPFERAETILRDQCLGVAYELGSVRMLLYRCLLSLGELDALASRAAAAMNDAEARGDIYTGVTLRTNATSFLALVRDDVATAERELALARTNLAAHGFHLQHVYWTFARSQISLYRGDVAAAEAAVASRWGEIKRSMLLRVQNVRIFLHDGRARAAVALLAAGGPPSARKTAERLARIQEGEGWAAATAQAAVIRAGLAFLSGDRAGALRLLERAEEGFVSVGMALLAAVAKWRRGALLGGDEGRALALATEEWMASRGIRNPSRMCALLAPGLPDHR